MPDNPPPLGEVAPIAEAVEYAAEGYAAEAAWLAPEAAYDPALTHPAVAAYASPAEAAPAEDVVYGEALYVGDAYGEPAYAYADVAQPYEAQPYENQPYVSQPYDTTAGNTPPYGPEDTGAPAYDDLPMEPPADPPGLSPIEALATDVGAGEALQGEAPAYESLTYAGPAYDIPADLPGEDAYLEQVYEAPAIPLEPTLQSLFEAELPQPYLAPAPAEAEDYYAADPGAAAWPLPLPPLPDEGVAAPAGIPQEYLYSDLSDFGQPQAPAPAASPQDPPQDPTLPDADLVLEAILQEVLGSKRNGQRRPPAAS